MLPHVKIQNYIGGSLESRYERNHHLNWSFDILDNSVDRVEKWLKKNCKIPIQKLLTLDIVVPSYRVDLKYLDPMINLEKPAAMSTMTIIIIDDPDSPNTVILKKNYMIKILYQNPRKQIKLGSKFVTKSRITQIQR